MTVPSESRQITVREQLSMPAISQIGLRNHAPMLLYLRRNNDASVLIGQYLIQEEVNASEKSFDTKAVFSPPK